MKILREAMVLRGKKSCVCVCRLSFEGSVLSSSESLHFFFFMGKPISERHRAFDVLYLLGFQSRGKANATSRLPVLATEKCVCDTLFLALDTFDFRGLSLW